MHPSWCVIAFISACKRTIKINAFLLYLAVDSYSTEDVYYSTEHPEILVVQKFGDFTPNRALKILVEFLFGG